MALTPTGLLKKGEGNQEVERLFVLPNQGSSNDEALFNEFSKTLDKIAAHLLKAESPHTELPQPAAPLAVTHPRAAAEIKVLNTPEHAQAVKHVAQIEKKENPASERSKEARGDSVEKEDQIDTASAEETENDENEVQVDDAAQTDESAETHADANPEAESQAAASEAAPQSEVREDVEVSDEALKLEELASPEVLSEEGKEEFQAAVQEQTAPLKDAVVKQGQEKASKDVGELDKDAAPVQQQEASSAGPAVQSAPEAALKNQSGQEDFTKHMQDEAHVVRDMFESVVKNTLNSMAMKAADTTAPGVSSPADNMVASVILRHFMEAPQFKEAGSRTGASQAVQPVMDARAADLKQSNFSSRGEQLRSSSKPLPKPQEARTLERVESALKEVAKSKDGKTISVRLDPPSLGSVKVDVSKRDGALHARIVAESARVGDMLKEKAHELVTTLRKLGLNVDNVTVSVGAFGSENRAAFGNGKQGQGQKKAQQPSGLANVMADQGGSATISSNAVTESGWVA